MKKTAVFLLTLLSTAACFGASLNFNVSGSTGGGGGAADGTGPWSDSGGISNNTNTIGISSAVPVTKFGVTGGATFSSSVTAQGGFFGDGSGLTNISGGTGGWTAGVATTTSALRVGISSAIPATALGVTGGIVASSSITANGGLFGNGATLTGSAVVGSTLTVTGNAFSVGGTTLAVDSGRVGISSAAPVTALGVGGGIIASSSITANGGFFGDGSGLTGITGGTGGWTVSGGSTQTATTLPVGIGALGTIAPYTLSVTGPWLWTGTDKSTSAYYVTPAANGTGNPVTTGFVQCSTYTTTTASPIIWSFDLPTSSDTVYTEGYIWAKCTSGTDRGKQGYYVIRSNARNLDGVVAEDAAEVLSSSYECNAACNVAASVSGTQARITVTGVAGDNITWHGLIFVHYMRE